VSYGPEVNRLSVLWQAQPTSSCFAALAEALRKRGALEQATAVAAAGVASRPDYLPGRLVMARIYGDQGQWQAADDELHAAIALDPTHPLVLETLEEVAGHLEPQAPVEEAPMPEEPLPAAAEPVPAVDESVEITKAFAAEPPEHSAPEENTMHSDPEPEPEPEHEAEQEQEHEPEPEPVLTESLAMLYRGQGHLAEAVGVLDALVARTPESGGRPVRDWLSALATSRTAPAPAASSFDAFYQAPSAPRSEAGDLEAFQAWLRELDR